MAIQNKKVPVTSDLTRAFRQVYDDINEVINSVNQSTDISTESGKPGDIRVIRDSSSKQNTTKHKLEFRSEDGWDKAVTMPRNPVSDAMLFYNADSETFEWTDVSGALTTAGGSPGVTTIATTATGTTGIKIVDSITNGVIVVGKIDTEEPPNKLITKAMSGDATISNTGVLTVTGAAGNFNVTNALTVDTNTLVANIAGYTDKVGIGTDTPWNQLSVPTVRYTTGTASQSLYIITGVGTSWTALMTGAEFIFADGTSAGMISAVDPALQLITVLVSQTVSSQDYIIYYPGLQCKTDGTVGVGVTPATAFHVHQNVKNVDLITCEAYGKAAGIGVDGLDEFHGVCLFQGTKANIGSLTKVFTVNSDFCVNIGENYQGLDGTTGGLIVEGDVGIGTIAPPNPLSVSPSQYSLGTASQSGTIVTGETGPTVWTTAMVGGEFVYADGTSSGKITARNTNTELIVTTSQTVSVQAYSIHYQGLHVNSTGLVGVGTSTPRGAFDAKGSGSQGVYLSNTGNAVYLPTDIAHSSGSSYFDLQPSNFRLGTTTGGKVTIHAKHATNDLVLGTYATNSIMRLDDATSNIGIQTASPTANLQVSQSVVGIGTVTIAGFVTCTGTGTQFTNTFKVGDTITITSTTQTRTIVDVINDTSMVITSADNTVGSAYTLVGGDRFSVLGNGNIGIGTTTPLGALHIGDDEPDVIIKDNTNAVKHGALHIIKGRDGNPVNTADTIGGVYFLPDRNVGANEIYGSSIRALPEGTHTYASSWPTNLTFWTNLGGNAATEKIRIQYDGNVGIGTTTPDSTLNLSAVATENSGLILESNANLLAGNGWKLEPHYESVSGLVGSVNKTLTFACDIGSNGTYDNQLILIPNAQISRAEMQVLGSIRIGNKLIANQLIVGPHSLYNWKSGNNGYADSIWFTPDDFIENSGGTEMIASSVIPRGFMATGAQCWVTKGGGTQPEFMVSYKTVGSATSVDSFTAAENTSEDGVSIYNGSEDPVIGSSNRKGHSFDANGHTGFGQAGTHDGADSTTVFSQSSATFEGNNIMAGDTLTNTTNGNTGTVASNNTTSITLTAPLTGGGDNLFQSGDTIETVNNNVVSTSGGAPVFIIMRMIIENASDVVLGGLIAITPMLVPDAIP